MPTPTDQELANMTVAEAMERWPQVLPLFHKHRLACAGCVMADFCKISDVPASYEHVEHDPFIAELQVLIEAKESI